LNPIEVKFEDLSFWIPNPINLALHKLIISNRRKNKDKALKDKDNAKMLLKSLIETGEIESIKKLLNSLPKKWQTNVKNSINDINDEDLKNIIKINDK
jgi:hypothetical protein